MYGCRCALRIAGGDLANNMGMFLNGFAGGIVAITQAERVQVTVRSLERVNAD